MGACVIQLDTAKVYVRVEWIYLEGTMVKLGFHPNFASLMMRCVTSISFNNRFNGDLLKSFRSMRGIRQGDLRACTTV